MESPDAESAKLGHSIYDADDFMLLIREAFKNAITVYAYVINPDKCKRCKMCVTAKYLDGGCMMVKYLGTKELGTVKICQT